MSTATARRAALYLRISLDQTGEELGIDRQREICTRLCEFKGWKVVEEYKDNSVSATKRKPRPAYEQMRRDAEAGAFDVVVVYKLDRLTRRPIEIEDWITLNEQRGITVTTADGDLDLSTSTGQTIAGILASVARGEVKLKSDRQKDAARQRADRGRPPLGVRLTGYTASGEVVPAEAAFVEAVFKRFAAGDSLRSLSSWAEEQGIPTRHGKPWNPSSIRTLLLNSRYAGRAIYRGKETGKRGGWTPLVTEDLFTTVQSILTDPRRLKHQGTDRKHLGSGLYLCDECSQRLVSWTGDRYRCPNGHLTRAQHMIDAYVHGVTCERIAHREDMAKLLAPKPEDGEAAEEVRQIRQRIARFASDYEAGLTDGYLFRSATDRATEELRAAEGRMQRAANPLGPILSAPDPVAFFEASPLMIRRAVIDFLFSVRIKPAPRGRRTFDPDSVSIEPKIR